MSESAVPDRQSVGGREQALQEELRGLIDVVGPSPLVDLLLERAFQIGATDLHFDPNGRGLRIRLRVDGLLHDVLELPAAMMPQVISRLKLMASMDITEKRLAQDGHISSIALDQHRDIRVGSGPTVHGERLVLRLMPDVKALTKLDELGFDDEQVKEVQRAISVPYGMVLSVGPVGSGKSTTVYACLGVLNDPTKSIVTIEDPVERRMPGLSQVQIDPKINFNFVEALRGVLRQDPNVMMIGEIRDPETAHIGVRASLTGVVVLSTLHSNDTASTINVFREFGIPPMFMADSLQAIISQRLLRKVCPDCRTTFHPDDATCQLLGIDLDQADSIELAKGEGCGSCFGTGFFGRTGVFEVMTIDRNIRDGILQNKSPVELIEIACANGMKTLEASAKNKVLAGITSPEEMNRVMLAFPAST